MAAPERHSYIVEGPNGSQRVYEWEQTFSDVSIFIDLPPGVRAKQLDVRIEANHLRVGIKDLPPYLDKDLSGAVKPSDSLWTIEDGVLTLTLAKAEEGATWASVIAGHELHEAQRAEEQKRLLLERFQAEHPGFDFSGAEFSGASVPDPRTFMRNLGQQQ